MDKDRLSTIVFTLTAIAAGIASAFFETNIGLALGLVLLAALTYVMSKALKEKFKWFMGNGFIIYLFFWIISWTIMSGVV